MKKSFYFLILAIFMLITFVSAESEYLREPIVFTFNSSADMAQNIVKANALNHSLENGYAKLVNTTKDPYFRLPIDSLDIDTSVYKYLKIRFKCVEGQGENMMGQIFFDTDKSGPMGSEGTYNNFTFVPQEDFIEVTMNLSDFSGYSGRLTSLRYDPYVGNENIPTATIYLDYIALFDNEKAMQKYPEGLNDSELQEIIDAAEQAKIKVVRTEKPENLVFSFGSADSFKGWATGINQIDYSFENGNLKITNTGTDPYITHKFPQSDYFYADDLSVLKVRFKPAANLGGERLMQFFFTTDSAVMGEDGTYKNTSFYVNGEWQEFIIDLKNDIPNSKWSGIITTVRYDTVVGTSGNDIVPIVIDYLGLFPSFEAAQSYSPEPILPSENHDTVTLHYGMQSIILPSGTVKNGDAVENYVLTADTAENPEKIKGGAVVKFTAADGSEDIVALSYNSTDATHYVARRPGTYSLTYNSKSYSDIGGHWGYSTIMFASNRKLFGGTSETEFSPDMPMTRGMFITVLGRMHGLDTSIYSGSTGYSDVSPTEYYAQYIEWAKEYKIMNPISEAVFGVESPISRKDMAIAIANYVNAYGYKLTAVNSTEDFSDISAFTAAEKAAVQQVQKAGIINGKGNGIFDPDGASTRAEVATVMSRVIKSILGLELDFFETSEESAEFQPLDRDRLIIGAYVPQPTGMSMFSENIVKDIAGAGIDFTILGYDNFNNLPLTERNNIFKWYEKYGIEFINFDINALKKASDGKTDIFDKEKDDALFYKDEISYAGISLADEPGYSTFAEMGQSVKEFNALHPNKLAFINLLPMYANDKQLYSGAWAAAIEYYDEETATYQKYLDEYIANIPTHYICTDIYPCYANKKTYENYAKSLEIVANACRESGRDFWIVNQSCSWAQSIRVIDLDDMYWQTYTVLSFGAKAILYYIFAARGEYVGTPLDADGNKTDTYYTLKAVHDELRRFEDIYLSYDNLGVMNHNSSPTATPWLELDTPYRDFDTISEIKCDKPLLIGCFEAKDKSSSAFTVVNYNDLSKPAAAEVLLKINGTVVTAYIDGYPTALAPNDDGYYSITLESGRGVFITVE